MQKFNREFEKAAEDLCNQEKLEYTEEESKPALETEDTSKGIMNTLNYIKFKEFLVEMCLLTEPQANSDCV